MDNTLPPLSEKEQAILYHLSKGVPCKVIPSLVYLSQRTFARIFQKMKQKTGCTNDNELCFKAGQGGWISSFSA